MDRAYVGIDYSTRRIDVAAIRGRALIYRKAWELGRNAPGDVAAIGRAIIELHGEAPDALICLEKPFRSQSQAGGNVALHRIPIRVETLALAAGFDVVFVAVNTWHSQILGSGSMKSAQAKRASLQLVNAQYRIRLTNDNEADAVCLAMMAATLDIERRAG